MGVLVTMVDGVTFYSQSFVEWRSRRSWWQGFLIGVLSTSVISIWGTILSTPSPPAPTTSSIRSLPVPVGAVPAFPVEIRLSIVSAKDFRNSVQVKSLMSTQKMEGVGAYTIINDNPCHIVMPDDFKIFVVAQDGNAWFDQDTGQIVAHEILHCLYGSWHKPWNAIPSKSNPASSKANASPR